MGHSRHEFTYRFQLCLFSPLSNMLRLEHPGKFLRGCLKLITGSLEAGVPKGRGSSLRAVGSHQILGPLCLESCISGAAVGVNRHAAANTVRWSRYLNRFRFKLPGEFTSGCRRLVAENTNSSKCGTHVEQKLQT